MTNLKELQNRITWLVELSTPTLQKLVECTGNSSEDTKECCSILLANDSVFDGDSSKEELVKAVVTINQLCELQSDREFTRNCEVFLTESAVFQEFPNFKTWEEIWQEVDCSLTTLNQFLKRKDKVDGSFEADRKMWQRMVLTLDFDLLLSIFKTEFYDHIELTDEDKTKQWTYEELEDLVKANDASKIEALYNVLPYPVDLFTNFDKKLPHVAVESDAKDVIKAFIQHGFDALEMISGKNVFHYAAELGRLDILKDLIEYQPDGATSLSKEKHTPLYYACMENQAPVVAFLSKLPDYRSNHLDFALIETAERGHADCLRILLQNRKCDVNALKEYSHDTALHQACFRGFIDCVKVIVQHPRCDVNIESRLGSTPLSFACQKGKYDCIEILLRHPFFKIDEKNRLANAKVATDRGYPDCAELLLQYSKK